LVVRDHVPVETDISTTPSDELDSDADKGVDATTAILPEEKEKFAAAKTSVGRDAAM
jgi:hypothetical protein